MQGAWDFTERVRRSIQEEEGLIAARLAKTNITRRTKAQSSLEKPLSHTAIAGEVTPPPPPPPSCTHANVSGCGEAQHVSLE
jgi:hypothetical protein